MSPAPTGPVLVTGCSSGIGLATAQALLDAGHIVYATARRPEALTELAERAPTSSPSTSRPRSR